MSVVTDDAAPAGAPGIEIGAQDRSATPLLGTGLVDPQAAAAHWLRWLQPTAKRAFDIAVSSFILVALLPVMLVVMAAIVLESSGPVFYRADRVGRGGRRMRMYKFRKMQPDAAGLKLTTGNDHRLTRVGAFLTRTKLDELPQFINVLRGDMSLVGPRPEDPGFVIERQADYEQILEVRPGITGLSQIAFAEESRILSEHDPLTHYRERIFPQKCALDRLYVQSAGLRMDLRIFTWTLVAVLARRQVAVSRTTGMMNLRRRDACAGSVAQGGSGRPARRLREHDADGLEVAEPHARRAPVAVRLRRLRLSFRRRPR
jgi:lipopolysaccharide/colanic/teichoic acid biosynthesis glycosyltransferase